MCASAAAGNVVLRHLLLFQVISHTVLRLYIKHRHECFWITTTSYLRKRHLCAKAFKRVTKAAYDDLNAIGISYARATHRGSTGGRKQCQVNKPIPVMVTSGRTALPTPSTRNNLAVTVRRCGIGADIRNLVCVCVCVQANK